MEIDSRIAVLACGNDSLHHMMAWEFRIKADETQPFSRDIFSKNPAVKLYYPSFTAQTAFRIPAKIYPNL